MYKRTAKDALVRWIVPTVAGAGLVVLFPTEAFGAPTVVVAGLDIHIVPLVAAAVIAAACVVFQIHLMQLPVAWRRDPVALSLTIVSILGAMISALAVLSGWLPLMAGALLTTGVLYAALALRVDRLRGRNAGLSLRRPSAAG